MEFLYRSRPLSADGSCAFSIKLPDIIQHILSGALEGARRLHLQGDQGRAVPQSLLHPGPLALRDIAGKGGVAPTGAAGEIPGLDGAGVDLVTLLHNHLQIVGN